MNETYNLELFFANDEGNSRKLTIRKPVTDLTEEDIAPAMQVIADTEIFEDQHGMDPYAAVKSARYVRTNIEEVFENVEA